MEGYMGLGLLNHHESKTFKMKHLYEMKLIMILIVVIMIMNDVTVRNDSNGDDIYE